jgi:phosphate transport system substrate-binding protein
MRWLGNIILFAAVSMIMLACDNAPKHADTLSKGNIDISADETFQPIIDEELKVFDSSYPDAHITVHYKPESECFKDYFDNKARIILVTRELSPSEKDVLKQQQVWGTSLPLAREGIAVIVNNDCPDTIFDMSTLRGILSGVYNKKFTVVFDNQGSSTVRYITDSVLKGEKPGSNVFAAKGNKEVVDYVTKNPNAIGFVGLGYVSDRNDPANTGAFIKTIKVAAIQNDSTKEFLKPYQAYIALKSYPLTRTLFYINREGYPGLGTGFANFLGSQRGQLIFFHAFLFPVRSEMVIRETQINTQNQ